MSPLSEILFGKLYSDVGRPLIARERLAVATSPEGALRIPFRPIGLFDFEAG
jgi:hypothetical protein